jgi:hypothetical protein
MSFWVVGATVAVGVGTAAYGASAAKKAASTAAKSSDAAIAEQQRQFDLIRSDTAPYRAIGNQALDTLGSIYGYKPASEYYGPANPLAGASPYQSPGYAESGLWGSKLNPANALGFKSDSTLGKIIDPVHALFGSKHGDEKRNMKAFLGQTRVMDLGNGMLALPDGTQFPQSQLQELAGTWYGATYAPDGDQSGWQQKYNDVLSRFKADPLNANVGKTTGQTSDGVPQGVTNGPSPALTDPNSPNYGAFFKSPDYNFRRVEGQRDLGNSFAARGGAFSGNALKALSEFNSNLAAGEFGNYFNRQAALAGIGQTATGQSANAGSATGQIVGNSLQNAGDARASGIAQGANAWGGALSGIGQGLGYYLANRQPSNGLSYFTPTVRKM